MWTGEGGGGDRGGEQGSVNRDNTEGDGRRDVEGKEESKNVFFVNP